MRQSAVAVLAVIAALIPHAAAAQPTRSAGVVLGYPAAVGVLWHVSDRLAIRPDVTLNRSETKTTLTSSTLGLGATGLSTITTETTTTQTDWTTATGLSALVTMADLDDLRLYLVPRVAYVRSKTSSEASAASGLSGLGPFTATNDGLIVSGGFGAHYMLGTRAAVFGEGAVQCTRQTFDSGIASSGTSSKLTAVGLRSAVGLVIYF